MLTKFLNMHNKEALNDYLDLLYNDLNSNFDDEKIVKFRKIILKSSIDRKELMNFYDKDMPLINKDELQYFENSDDIFDSINEEKIDETILDIIDFVINNYDIKFDKLISFLDKISSIDNKIFKSIFYKFNYNNYTKNERRIILRKNYSSLETEKIDELEKLISKIKVMLNDVETRIIFNYKKLEYSEREKYEEKYVQIIKSVGNISSKTKNIIPKFKNYYCYNEEIENQFFELGLYKQYCYSKFNRLKHMIYEEEKLEKLKDSYIYYFINSENLSKDYMIDNNMLQFLKNNINYKKL